MALYTAMEVTEAYGSMNSKNEHEADHGPTSNVDNNISAEVT